MFTVTGEFEIHVTVRPVTGRADSPVPYGALERYAAERAWKFTHIVLDRGRAPSQPMLTLRADGTLPAARSAAESAAAGLAGAGFTVVRTKIEAAPWAAGVPVSDEDGRALGPRYYFEHHLKLLLAEPPPPDVRNALTELVAAHAAHLSRNARRVRPDGRAERFVTQRCRLVGRDTAGRRLRALTADLRAGGHEIVSMEREFVVYDSDEGLDAGWIVEEEAAR
ncbi:hypothetical protein [Streptomyces sp. ME19-01-6]|uniref:hypothetical protein n=1 Tax=Streptomyces sp. ME19-01-6 TaxID=3028686 RepID=UPI0029BD92C9|nr:hypothetical protein [Streptomyces sp. ME19-01-6]MDX3225988.1 hypothetical protein [Streptomyces sp. ME19-01-6]